MGKCYTLVTSARAVKSLRKAYAAQGTKWPRSVSLRPLPGNPAGNTMLRSRYGSTLRFMAMATGGTLGVEE